MSNIYYNYIYLDPRKPGRYCYEGLNFSLLFEPFYVGKGKGKRMYDHLTFCNLRDKNKHKIRKITKIISSYDMKEFIIQLNKELSNEQSGIIEKDLITNIGRSDLKLGSLTNLTDGGEGTFNIIKTPMMISKMLKTRIENHPPITCEFCGKVVDHMNYQRWHGEKCNSNPNGTVRFNLRKVKKVRDYKNNNFRVNNPTKGKVRDPELIAKIVKTRKENNSNIICEFCGLSCNKTNHTRWHGKNCKQNPNKD